MADFNLYNKPTMAENFAQGYNIGAPIGQVAGNVIQARQQKEAQEQQQAAYQQAYNELMKDPTSIENMMAVYQLTPNAQKEGFTQLWDKVNAETKNKISTDHAQWVAAVEDGTDASIKFAAEGIANYAQSLKASGNEEAAAYYENILANIANPNPEVRKLGLGQIMGQGTPMDEFREAMGEMDKMKQDQVASDTTILKAGQGITFKTEDERRQWMVEMSEAGFNEEHVKKLAVMTNIGNSLSKDMSPKDQRAGYDRISNEYIKLTGDYRDVLQGYTNVVAEAKRGNELEASGADAKAVGVSDLALVTALTRMIDPGATVRQSDIENAVETAGGGAALITAAKGLFSGQKLNKNQRNEMIALASRAKKSSGAILDQSEKFLEKRLDIWGISPEDMFIDRETGKAPVKKVDIVAYRKNLIGGMSDLSAEDIELINSSSLEELQEIFGE